MCSGPREKNFKAMRNWIDSESTHLREVNEMIGLQDCLKQVNWVKIQSCSTAEDTKKEATHDKSFHITDILYLHVYLILNKFILSSYDSVFALNSSDF